MSLPISVTPAGAVTSFRAGVGYKFASLLNAALVRGKYQADLENLSPGASWWSDFMDGKFSAAYGMSAPAIWLFAKERFASATLRNFTARSDINSYVQSELAGATTLSRHLYLFFLWVGGGVDPASGPEENAATFNALFDKVFLGAITDASLDSFDLTGEGDPFKHTNRYDQNSTYLYDATTSGLQTVASVDSLGDVAKGVTTEPTTWLAIGKGISGLLSSIGIGSGTVHPSFDQVNPKGSAWAETMYPRFVAAYGTNADAVLMQFVRVNFQVAMTKWWGLGPSLNQSIKADIAQATSLKRALWLFFVWVGTNQDQNSGEDTKIAELNELFRNIFVAAIIQANLSADVLIGGTPIADVIPGTTPAASGGTVLSNTVAQAGGGILVVVVLIAIFFLLKGKK